MRRGYVYFIRVEKAERPIKIGYTRHPLSRLNELQPWLPWPLTFVAVFECSEPEKEESAIHRRLAAVHVRGEWYVGAAVEHEIDALSRRLKLIDPNAKDLRDSSKRTATARLRVTSADLERYQKAARSQQQSMSDWIRRRLNARVAGYKQSKSFVATTKEGAREPKSQLRRKRCHEPSVRSALARLRVYPKELAAWKRCARADALTLSTWVRDGLHAYSLLDADFSADLDADLTADLSADLMWGAE